MQNEGGMLHVKINSYPGSKESAVPWLGRIPDHWDLLRGKYLFVHNKVLNSTGLNTNVLSLTLRGVVNNNPENPEGLVPKDYSTYQIFDKDDLVFKLIDLENRRTSRVGLVHEIGIMSPAYIRLVPRGNLCVKFFYYQFYDLYSRGIFNQLGAGVRATLGSSDLLDIRLCVPPAEEQQHIVAFLDSIERRVRRFVRAKRQVIRLLNERKQVIVSQAVSLGLNPTTSLRPSDIPWFPALPAHWDTVRLKHLFAEVDDRSTSGTETLLSLRMYQGLVPHTSVSEKPIGSEQLIGYKRTQPREIVMNRMRAAMGMFAVTPQPGIVSPDYAIFRQVTALVPEYYVHLFKTPLMRGVFKAGSKGLGTGASGFLRLYSETFGSISIPKPPTSEQAAIVREIQDRTSTLDLAISRIEREISLVTEYQQQLMTDVVTGKLDLRNLDLTDANLAVQIDLSDNGPESDDPTETEEELEDAED